MFFRFNAFFLICVCVALQRAHGLAISSSKSSGKKLVTNDKATGGGGFGAKKNAIPFALHTPDTSPKIQALVQFLNSQGTKGLNDGIEVGFDKDTGIRGVYATRPFKKGELLSQIPSDCALALSDPQLSGSDVPTMAHAGRNLVLMYLEDEQAKALWKPYLDTLPTLDSAQFSPTPDFFSNIEIEELEFPRAVEMALVRKQEVMDLAAVENMPMEQLQFATWLVSSRSLRIEMSAGDVQMPDGVSAPSKSIQILLPYLDFVNHSSNTPNAELHLVDPEKDEAWFAIRATRPIPEGKEVTINYGNGVHSSVEILNNYGFVPMNNKFDEMMLKKGGEGCIEKLEDWSTSLEEDEAAYEMAEGNRRTILALRIKLKKAYADI